jgi:hypothetical protein
MTTGFDLAVVLGAAGAAGLLTLAAAPIWRLLSRRRPPGAIDGGIAVIAALVAGALASLLLFAASLTIGLS